MWFTSTLQRGFLDSHFSYTGGRQLQFPVTSSTSSAEHTLNLTPLVDTGDLGDAFSSPATNQPYPNFALLTVSLTYLQTLELLRLGWVPVDVRALFPVPICGRQDSIWSNFGSHQGLKEGRESHTKRCKRLFLSCLGLHPHVWVCCMSQFSAGLLTKARNNS